MSEVEIPQAWTQTALGKIAQVDSGIGFPNEYQGITTGDLPFFKVGDVSNAVLNNNGRLTVGKHYVSLEVASILRGKPLKPGSTVFAKIGEAIRLNRRGYVTTDCLIDNNVMAVKAVLNESDRYIHYFLRTVQFTDVLRATTVPSLRKGDVEGLQVPLAPLPEQKRIADKLDSVLARVDACRDRLDRLPTLLKRFRHSILAAATSGAITKDWRAKRGDIPAGKAQQEVEQREQARKTAVKVRGLSIKAAPELLFELPPSWNWIDNHRLADDKANAICAGPFGTIFKAKDFREKGVPIIFLRHVAAGQYLTRKPGFMDEAVWKNQHQEYSVYGGELLVTKLGDPPGSSCIYPKEIGTAMVTPDVMKMCVDEEVCHPKYLMHYFNSPASKKIIESVCFGVTRLRIDLSLFKTFPVPLPPIEEQTEIVRRVEILFAFADRLETRLAAARRQVGQLTPALLAKAFRGELVAQDPADEPAAELLKRLAAQRAAAPKTKRGRAA